MEAENFHANLHYVRQIIEETRSAVLYDGKDFIIWGVLVVIGLLISYGMAGQAVASWTAYTLVWLSVTAIGWLCSWLLRRKRREQLRARTFIGQIFGTLWLSCGIVMTLVGLAAFLAEGYSAYAMIALLCLILGIGYATSGALLRLRWLQLLAGGWWLGGAAFFFLAGPDVLLMFALMMFALQIIPGLWFYRQARHKTG